MRAGRLLRLGEQLGRMRRKQTFRELQAATGLSRPTLIAAEQGGDIQLSTLLRILEAHGQIAEFDRMVGALARSCVIEAGKRLP
ncbi:hypothetical protein AS149_13055 [Burkholderia cenocepacia]|nr:hypothetical protein AS149_13055 [Burkholderia cenocepacia]